MAVLLALFGLLQVALAAGARETLRHAAARAARARAVGFNDWMVEKAVRVATIPISGRRTVPDSSEGGGADFELARIPGYLASENHARADWALSYEEWERGQPEWSVSADRGGGVVRATVSMDFPLIMPLAGLLFPFAETDEEGVRRLPMEAQSTAPSQLGAYMADAPR